MAPDAVLNAAPVSIAHHVIELAMGTGSNAASSGDGDCKMRLTGSGAANQYDIALPGQEGAAGEGEAPFGDCSGGNRRL